MIFTEPVNATKMIKFTSLSPVKDVVLKICQTQNISQSMSHLYGVFIEDEGHSLKLDEESTLASYNLRNTVKISQPTNLGILHQPIF